MQAMALFGQLGLSIAIPLGLFVYLGHWADDRFHTGPVLLLVGMALGSVVAFYTMVRMLKDATQD